MLTTLLASGLLAATPVSPSVMETTTSIPTENLPGLKASRGPVASVLEAISNKSNTAPTGPAPMPAGMEVRKPEKLPSLTEDSGALPKMPLVNVKPSGQQKGTQVGLVNVALGASTQVGLINVARSSRTQVGLLNFSRETRTPVGLVNASQGSVLRADVFMSDNFPLNLGLRVGSQRVQALLLVGMGGKHDTRLLSLGIGASVRLPLAMKPWVEVDLTASSVRELNRFSRTTNIHPQLKVRVGIDIAPRLSVYGAITGNAFIPLDGEARRPLSSLASDGRTERKGPQLWPGLEVGVRF